MLEVRNNVEKDSSECKNVNLRTLILLAFQYFRSHTALSSKNILEFVDVLVCGQAEISNLVVALRVNKNVFWLHITMYDALPVHVLERVKHLLKEVSSIVLTQGSFRGIHHVIQIMRLVFLDTNEIHDDKCFVEGGTVFFCFLVFEAISTLAAFSLHSDNSFVLESAKNSGLLINGENRVVVSIRNFDSDELVSFLVLPQMDYGAASFTKFLDYFIRLFPSCIL